MSREIVNKKEFETLVNPENKRIVDDFLTEKKAEMKSEKTIRQYWYDMRINLTYILRHFENKSLIELTRKDIRNLSIIIKNTGVSNARANRQMSCLRSCLEFAADDDDYDYEYNVGSRVKGLPKKPVREKTYLNDEQIHWIKEKLVSQGDILKAVYLMLSYHSGARKSEIHQVMKDGLTSSHATNKVAGKWGGSFRIYYEQETQDLIKKYLELRGPDDIPNLFVKVQKNGKRAVLGTDAFNGWSKKFSEYLSERENKFINIYPHAFRNSRIDNLERSGHPLNKIKTLVNHKSVSTTEGYLSERGVEHVAELFGLKSSDF